tara:strand:+ start:266 stop:1816 length:1551 start_codon:yes stop_codon:yes gene_type:complete
MGYTKSTAQTVEDPGDSGAGGSLATSRQIVITPFSGYTVSASDFSHGTLPTGVQSVAFANTATPYQPGNLVHANVTLTAAYAMPSADTSIDIPIVGDAYQGVKTDVGYVFTIEILQTAKITASATAVGTSAVGTARTVAQTASGGYDIYTFTGSVPVDPPQTDLSYPDYTVVGTLTAAYDSGFHQNNTPTLAPITTGHGDSHVLLQRKSQTLDPTTGLTTAEVFDILYKSDKDVTSSYRIRTELRIDEETDFTTDKKIYGINFKGSEFDAEAVTQDAFYIDPSGAVETLVITGSPGARFNLTWTDATPPLTIPGPFYPYQGEIIDGEISSNASNSFGSQAEREFTVLFPELPSTSGVDWSFVLTPGTDTVFDASMNTDVETLTVYQYPNPVTTITNSNTSGAYSVAGASTITFNGSPGTVADTIAEKNKLTRVVNMSWTLSGSGTFTVLKASPVLSDFTNTDPRTNGGTEVSIDRVAVAGNGTSTVTITGRVSVEKFGKTSVAMNLNLDNIVSYTP